MLWGLWVSVTVRLWCQDDSYELVVVLEFHGGMSALVAVKSLAPLDGEAEFFFANCAPITIIRP